jgi:hypothetical protein
MTRRQWTAVLAAAPALAQTPPPAGEKPATPPDDLKTAVEQMQRNSEQLRRFEIPLSAEPSFAFKP